MMATALAYAALTKYSLFVLSRVRTAFPAVLPPVLPAESGEAPDGL